MKIFITTPSFGLNGGIRNIIELANGLQELGHEVILYNQNGHLRSPHYQFKCRVVNTTHLLNGCDRLVISSPHAVDLAGRIKTVAWVQMLESYFRPGDDDWLELCRDFQMIDPAIFTATWGRDQVGNGNVLGTWVNLDHFPISYKHKDGRTILLESPEPTNPAKDVDLLALQVAAKLKKEGYYIISYGAKKLTGKYQGVPHEHFASPTLAKMNELYERATILLKATKYDFRSVSCLEGMTKGCVTVRAITHGDEDLNGDNAFICDYGSVDELYTLAKTALTAPYLSELAENCRYYIQQFGKSYWLPKYEEIICK